MELLHIEFYQTGQFAIALVIGVGIAAQWIAGRLGLPSILVLLAAGFAIGGLGFQLFDPAQMLPTETLFDFVSVSVAIILFEGGLSLKLNELQKGGLVLRRLLWIGIPVTLGLVAVFYKFLYDSSWEFAFLLGSILVVTGPTVIGPLLQLVRPMGRTGPIIKWEGILNDPIGAILAVLMFEVVIQRGVFLSWGSVVIGLCSAIVIGLIGGWFCAKFVAVGLRRSVIPGHLQGAVAVAVCVILFMIANGVQEESGLLAVTIFGIFLANTKSIKIHNIKVFHEHLRTILIAVLFIVLASRFTRDQLQLLDLNVMFFLIALIVVVRPVSVALSTFGSGLSWREKVLLSWMAPRGIVAAAVASLFAMKFAKAGISDAGQLESLIYAVIVGTVIIYGLGAKPAAQLLGLRPPKKQGVLLIGAQSWSRALAAALRAEGHPVHLLDFRRENVKAAVMAGLSACDLSILDARIETESDMPPGISVMLALSPSNEENALAVLRYEEEFGAANVYQIVVDREDEGSSRELQPSLQYCGNILYLGKITYGDLDDQYGNGVKAVVTKITDKFTEQHYHNGLTTDATPILVISQKGRVLPILGKISSINPGDRVVSLKRD